ncbi:MAG: PH domain-containing protein [Bacteroidota bacterium]
MKEATKKTYRSAVSTLIFVPVILLIVIIALLPYVLLGNLFGSIVILSLSILLMTIAYFNVHYQIDRHQLRVSSLLSKREVDIFQVSSLKWVRSFHNQTNVYSFSEKRLRIVYCYGKYVDISPKSPEEFIEQLLAVNPMIQYSQKGILQE